MTSVRREAPTTCDNCIAYSNALKALLADWHAAGSPQGPSEWSEQIGLGLAMYCEHLGEHLPT